VDLKAAAKHLQQQQQHRQQQQQQQQQQHKLVAATAQLNDCTTEAHNDNQMIASLQPIPLNHQQPHHDACCKAPDDTPLLLVCSCATHASLADVRST
jgi:hypothetical protein